jgi:hypothetical protein
MVDILCPCLLQLLNYHRVWYSGRIWSFGRIDLVRRQGNLVQVINSDFLDASKLANISLLGLIKVRDCLAEKIAAKSHSLGVPFRTGFLLTDA